jgi:hypothetical protein
MRLISEPVPGWPKLVWVARIADGSDAVEVRHGPCVETRDDWCAEAVWAGDFAAGDFDRTDLVFGTGVRCRGPQVLFVSSGTTDDRLWYTHHAGAWHVSNSLPALLAATGLSLRDDYPDYSRDVATLRLGLTKYVRSFPTDAAPLQVVYFSNLLYDGQTVREIEKPDTAPHFAAFEDYRQFLFDTAARLGANLRDAARTHRVTPLASISTGYDSATSAVVARQAGCTQAVTFTTATSLANRPDSGAANAGRLGLACREYPRTAAVYPHEVKVWAAAGRPGELNWTQFDFPEPLCLFFTGIHGDEMWSRKTLDLSDSFWRAEIDGFGLCEFRLFKGVFHCAVPFWGCRRAQEIQAITFSKPMEPWARFTDYDRPIPTRLLEEAGLPRTEFGQRKNNTSTEAPFLWPYSAEAQALFAQYLKARNVAVPSSPRIALARRAAVLDNLLYTNLLGRWGLDLGLRRRLASPATALLFPWANANLKGVYQEGQRDTANGRRSSRQ